MKIDCNVIKDLMPLYIDDYCSEESKQLIDEHLKKCENCKTTFIHMTSPLPDEDQIIMESSEIQDTKVIKKGIKKFRRLWIMSLIFIILLSPVAYLSINQARGEGVCFTNIDYIYRCNQFLNLIEKENFEKAFEYLEFDSHYRTIYDCNIEITSEEYRKVCKKYFVKNMQLLYRNGYKVADSRFVSISKGGGLNWDLEYKIYMKDKNGNKYFVGKLRFSANGDSINVSGDEPLFAPKEGEPISNEVTFLSEASMDWFYEAHDEVAGENQFKPCKEHELWR